MTRPIVSLDPSTGRTVWRGQAADAAEVGEAMTRARKAFEAWSDCTDEQRIAVAERYADLVRADAAALAGAISNEVGKPPWEAVAETELVAAKVAISVEALRERRSPVTTGPAVTRFRPHGVCVVLGPYNYPAHLANGHIVPALIAGNCVVFKPSERAPSVGELLAGYWAAAGLPEGVLQVVQGDRHTAEAMLDSPELDGVFVTGSVATGLAVHRRFAGRPQRILALELGGNNPLVVHDVADHAAAAYLTACSAYLSAGQRCTSARRLIVPVGPAGDHFIDELVDLIGRLRVGAPTDRPEPFMGPVIDFAAAQAIVAAQTDLLGRGGRSLVASRHVRAGTGLLSPGLIDVSEVVERTDQELFGPLLQLVRTPDPDTAITEAATTAFGLAAGIITDDAALYARFARGVRAGVVNWNHELVGASSRAPFGGVGLSGNHRPSAFYAADYCSYPVASIEKAHPTMPDRLLPGIADR